MAPLLERMGTDLSSFVNEGSLNFYGAPAVALIFLDESCPSERMADIGAFMAHKLGRAGHGLASCPIGLVKSYEDDVKDHSTYPNPRFWDSIALGKPEAKAPSMNSGS
jgi:hypothetical protein